MECDWSVYGQVLGNPHWHERLTFRDADAAECWVLRQGQIASVEYSLLLEAVFRAEWRA